MVWFTYIHSLAINSVYSISKMHQNQTSLLQFTFFRSRSCYRKAFFLLPFLAFPLSVCFFYTGYFLFYYIRKYISLVRIYLYKVSDYIQKVQQIVQNMYKVVDYIQTVQLFGQHIATQGCRLYSESTIVWLEYVQGCRLYSDSTIVWLAYSCTGLPIILKKYSS